MNRNFYSVPAILLLSASCSFLWKSKETLDSVHWLDENRVALVVLTFEEKDSWDPTMGTTEKRNLQSRIELREAESDKVLRSLKAPGQATQVQEATDGSIWVLLTSGQVQRLQSDGKTDQARPTLIESSGISLLLVSPNRERILLIRSANTDKSEAKLYSHTGAPIGAFSFNAAAEPPAAWSADSEFAYLRTRDQVMEWTGSMHRTSRRFPECFSPGTAQGGHLSPNGRSYSRSDLDVKPEIAEAPGAAGFARRTMTGDAGRIRCP